MSFYNVGVFVGDKYFHQCGEGIEFVNQVNEICKNYSSGHKYSLAIDASTTCTGFCLMRDDELVHVVFDYARKDTEKEQFFRELEFILTHLIWGLTMEVVLIEQPILQAKNKHTRSVLLTLCKRLKNQMKEIPELYGIKPIDIRPNSWKSFMFDGDNYKGGYNDKATIARCICNRYPIYEAHYNNVTSKDYDCFDAVGILRYYLDSFKDTLGDDVNFASAEYTHFTTVWVCYGPNPEENFRLQNDVQVFNMKWNKDYNYYKNVKMASTGHDIVIMQIEDDFLRVLMSLEAGVAVQTNIPMYVAIHRESLFKTNKRFISLLEDFGYRRYTVY